ncbi:hypothetical protein J7M23_04240 [Candidatus Sumerlaeota bacterium]|nr:hypothetical protein [Candidatus Sumerlaeota bacterium]
MPVQQNQTSKRQYRSNPKVQGTNNHPRKEKATYSTTNRDLRDKDKVLIHKFARREIEHFIDQVCSYLFSEEQFTNYVRQRLAEEIYAKVKRKLKKVPTPTQAVAEALRALGQPSTIAKRYTTARRKLQIPWAETFYILLGIISVKFRVGSKEEFFKEISSAVIYLLFLLVPVLAYITQMFIASEFEVSSEGLFYKRAFKSRVFIGWDSIVALKVRWRLLVGRYVAIYLSNRQRVSLLPVTTNFAYVVSSLLANVASHTMIDPGVRAILQKQISAIKPTTTFQRKEPV